MPKPKVFIFAPNDETGTSHRALEAAGCELTLGEASWHTPMGDNEGVMVSSNVGSGLGPGVEWAARSVLAALRGEVPDNVFNKEVLPRWRERFGGNSVF